MNTALKNSDNTFEMNEIIDISEDVFNVTRKTAKKYTDYVSFDEINTSVKLDLEAEVNDIVAGIRSLAQANKNARLPGSNFKLVGLNDEEIDVSDFGGEFTSGIEALEEIQRIRQQLEVRDHLPRYPKKAMMRSNPGLMTKGNRREPSIRRRAAM